MALNTSIVGSTTLSVGQVSQYTNATTGGVWTSSDTSIFTIDPTTGMATAVSAGSVAVIYTIGADYVKLGVDVDIAMFLTNGLNYSKIYPALSSRVTWQSQGGVSDSNRYFEDFHPLCTTEILDATRAQNDTDLTTYLANKQRSVVMECLNAVYNAPQIVDQTRLTFYRQDVPIAIYPVTAVPNNGQFVGLKIFAGMGDYAVRLNSLLLFFSKTCTFNLYLYNDMYNDYIKITSVTAQAMTQTKIDLGQNYVLNNLMPDYKGGRWFLGYFQDDIQAQGANAMYYNMNVQTFHTVSIIAFSAPVITDINGNRNFARNTIGQNNLMYGMNVEVTSFKDSTNNVIQNSHLWDELIGNYMAAKVIGDIIFSYRSGNTPRVLQNNVKLEQLYADLNGYTPSEREPRILGLKDKVNRSIATVKQGLEPNRNTFVGTA
jgi:hypothetical protein